MLFFISVQVKAQFLPIASNDSISWTIKHEVPDMARIGSLYLSDTISLNKKQYHRVNNIEDDFDKGLVGYFREDSLAGKAWFWGLKDSTEHLLMDLNMRKGDSIYLNMVYGKKYAHITNVEVENGRRTLTTDYHFGGGFISENLKFIEGVGPNASILYQVDSESAWAMHFQGGFLVCKAFHNNTLVYAWDTISYGCGPLWDNISSQTIDQIKIFPNPANKSVTISGQGVLTTEIFDLIGNLIISTTENNLNINRIPTGVYFITVSRGKEVIKRDRLIISN
jgi:hypothetical protein